METKEYPTDVYHKRYTAKNKDKLAAYRKAYEHQNRDKLRIKRITRSLGISQEQYNEMYGKQHGKCSICSISLNNDKHTHVDHNHVTKQVRGLLCGPCNRGIGIFKENAELLLKAIRYLNSFMV